MVEQATLEDAMFADSMLEVSWDQRLRRSWTTLGSFGLEAVIVGLLLLVPLLRTVVLPAGRALTTPVSWGAPPPAAPVQHHVTAVAQSNLADDVLVTPPSIPNHVAVIEETTAPPQVSYNFVGIDGGTGVGSRDGIWRSLADSTSRAVSPPPPAPAPTVRAFRTSSMLEGSLIRSVQPVYPPLARSARIQGAVVLSAVIGKDGAIKDLRTLSGHPMLVAAAVNAVSQWAYRPYILNNEAIEVETRITVNFNLSGN